MSQKTKVHRVTLCIVDTDDIGGGGVIEVLENARYSNDCMRPQVVIVETQEIAWSDDHPINSRDGWRRAFNALFVASPAQVEPAPEVASGAPHDVSRPTRSSGFQPPVSKP